MKIINLNWQDLTPENITKLYLYGDLNNTHDLTSPKIHREGSSNDANSAQVTVKINNFYDYMTNPQSPLRYANLSQIPIVWSFFSEKRMYVDPHPKISPPTLPEGKYTLEQVQKHFQDNYVPTRLTYKYYGMQHMNMDPSSKDYAKRVYVFNSQGIHLGKGAVFVVQPNGERYIKNAAPTIASEDFDFVSSNIFVNFFGNNGTLIPNIDPHGIGRTVKISYPSYKDENTTEYTKYIHDYAKTHGNYTEDKFKKDMKRYAHEHSPIKGLWNVKSAMNSVIDDLWKSGITKFLDKEGNVITYENPYMFKMYLFNSNNSNMIRYLFQKHKDVKCYPIDENSIGTPKQPESEEKETKLQSCSVLSPEDMVPNAQIADFDSNESIDENNLTQSQENEKGAYLMENGILLSSGLNTTAAEDIKLATKNNEDDYGMEM